MAPKAKPSKIVYDYTGFEKGMRVQAESEGVYYAADVVAVSTSKKREKAPIKVHFAGYGADYDVWVGGDRLRSKALKKESTEGSPASSKRKDALIIALKKQLAANNQAATIINADEDADTETHLSTAREEAAIIPFKTIYCNGVYDMCHIGHQRLFQRAGTHGKLLVGVHGDEACKGYKRPPIMSADERATQVAGCKGVWRVLKNAPLETISEEFMNKYKIDIIAIGDEYLEKDLKDDKWYKYPREAEKFVGISRTEGISTSDLIARCAKEAADAA